MATQPTPNPKLASAVEEAVRDLLRVTHWGAISYVSLPLFYPSGSPITVRVAGGGARFSVDDGGFAYRELESVGAERSFHKTAANVADGQEVESNRRLIFTDANANELARAISDVACASWTVTNNVFIRLPDEDEEEIGDYLRDRLIHIFGPAHLEPEDKVVGSSTSEWDVSAILNVNGARTVFQAVGSNAISVYRTSTAFHDIAALPSPPKLVAVVKDKEALGPKLRILSQAGRVIQSDQPDDVYKRAVK